MLYEAMTFRAETIDADLAAGILAGVELVSPRDVVIGIDFREERSLGIVEDLKPAPFVPRKRIVVGDGLQGIRRGNSALASIKSIERSSSRLPWEFRRRKDRDRNSTS